MVDQLPLHAGANPTLDELWRGWATRLSPRTAALCLSFGVAVVAGSRLGDVTWIATLSGVIITAFGADALLWSTAGDREHRSRARHMAGVVARMTAALAAAAIALVVLGMIFGDKIEVMRR